MASCPIDDEFSDDEIFIGKLTIKEIRKRLLPDRRRHTITRTKNDYGNVSNDSIKIIETHSEPEMELDTEMNKSTDYISTSDRSMDWDIKSTDDTFLNLEKMVADLSKQSNVNNDLDNTLDIVNFILDSAAKEQSVNSIEKEQCDKFDIIIPESPCLLQENNIPKVTINDLNGTSHVNTDLNGVELVRESIALNSSASHEQDIIDKANNNIEHGYRQSSSNNKEEILDQVNTANYTCDESKHVLHEEIIMPIKEYTQSGFNSDEINDHNEECDRLDEAQTKDNVIKTIDYVKNECNLIEKSDNKVGLPPIIKVISTPSPNVKYDNHIFKTPKNPGSSKKNLLLSMTKSPGTVNNYKHVMSPVAYYINNSPQTPLLRKVVPKKPPPNVSCIPKLIKNPDEINKENIELQKTAYRSAKKTSVVKSSVTPCLPGQWAKKLILSEAAVKKHTVRLTGQNRRPNELAQDSFDNLSLLPQADLSIHTETTCFKNNKN